MGCTCRAGAQKRSEQVGSTSLPLQALQGLDQVTGTVTSIHTGCQQTQGLSPIQQHLMHHKHMIQGKVRAIALYPRLYLSLQTARTAGLTHESHQRSRAKHLSGSVQDLCFDLSQFAEQCTATFKPFSKPFINQLTTLQCS